MKIAVIDKDHIAEKGEASRAGIYWTAEENSYIDTNDAPKVRFRMKDDDGEIYYGGWLLNDGAGEVQSLVLGWGMHDGGCTTIEVKIEDKWEVEIG